MHEIGHNSPGPTAANETDGDLDDSAFLFRAMPLRAPPHQQATIEEARASPPVISRRVVLRHTGKDDYDYLFRLSMTPSNSFLWRYRGATPSPDSFVHSLWTDVLVMFTIISVSRAAPVGLVYAYRPDFKSGTVHMALVIDDIPDRPLIAHESVLLFVNYVFTCWNFRKIYGETSERNMAQFRGGSSRFFVEEGRLREHDYFGGKYWDLIFTAMYRDQWMQIVRRLLPRIQPLSGTQ